MTEPKSLTLDDLMYEPTKYGLPTFEEFCKNPDKWRINRDNAMNQLERGSLSMKNQIDKHVYYVSGYKCSSLEQAQRILREEYGYSDATDLSKLGARIELQDIAMGKVVAHVYLEPKREPISATKIIDDQIVK